MDTINKDNIFNLNSYSRQYFFNKIEENQTIYLLRHTSPDGDALGSQYGLKKLLRHHFPNKNIYIVGDDITSYFSKYFPKPDLKIIPKNTKDSLIIALDTANFDRLNDRNFKRENNYVFSIDHHPKETTYSHFEICEPTASSVSEMIINLFEEKEITKKASLYLYIGILTDTGRFKYDNFSSKTSIALSRIVDKVDVSRINDYFDSVSLKNIKNFSNVTKFIKRKNEDKLLLVIPKWYSFFKRWKKGAPKTILYELQRIYEVNYILFSSYDFESKKWKGSLRSKKGDISILAQKFNGGGHKLASGFTTKDKKELKQIKKEFLSLKEEQND